jgi:hypothetical protein
MGCEVTVFSHSPKKKGTSFTTNCAVRWHDLHLTNKCVVADEAKEFGATNFVSTEDKEAMQKSEDSQDFILVTTDKIECAARPSLSLSSCTHATSQREMTTDLL